MKSQENTLDQKQIRPKRPVPRRRGLPRFLRSRKRQWMLGAMLALAVLAVITLVLTRSRFMNTVGTVLPGGPSAAAPSVQGAGLLFVENVGQFDAEARFQVLGGNRQVWLAQDAIWVTALESPAPAATDVFSMPETTAREGVNLKLSFADANPQARLEAFDPLETRVAYLLGNDPANWRVDVPVWGGVRYVDIYPGADLIITSANGRWDWQLNVKDAEFDLSAVNLRVEGATAMALEGAPQDRGATQALRLTTAVGEFTVPLLHTVGESSAVSAPRLEGAVVDHPFIEGGAAPEAPTQGAATQVATDLIYGTYLLGSGKDWAHGIAVDASGAAYVTGGTTSLDFPTTPGVFDATYNGGVHEDIFVVKLSPDGAALEYATFIGGTHHDWANDIVIDAQGNAYLTGGTRSGNFPTTANAFDRLCGSDGNCNLDAYGNPQYDAFALKLNATGSSLLYATFIGGSGAESGSALAIDAAGSAYLVGSTNSADFPTTAGAFNATPSGLYDIFVTKLDPGGALLEYATLIGGSGNDSGEDLALGASGSVYVTGVTFSHDFPTTPTAFNPTRSGGGPAAFVLKLHPDGAALEYATFLGGANDHGRAMAVDTSGAAYIMGNVFSQNFPVTPGAFDQVHHPGDLFIAKLDAAGRHLIYATFLGGANSGYGTMALTIDDEGYVYACGGTEYADFPTTAHAFNREYNPDPTRSDAFIVRLNPVGSALAYATFLGGSGNDAARAITLDADGNAYIAGFTNSSDFPTTPDAWAPEVTEYAEHDNAFVVKMQLPPRYAISGQVVDSGANPRANIPLTLNDGRTAITDANGYYVFAELPANAYTVMAAGELRSVSLLSAPVNVPPDFAHYDFVLLPQPIAQTFVPGIAGQITYQDAGAGATLEIPANALRVETTLIITPTLPAETPEFIFTGVAFDLEAYPQGALDPNFTFAAPAAVTVTYRPDMVLSERENALMLLQWTGTKWEDAAENCGVTAAYARDVDANRLTIPLCRTGRLALALPRYQVYLPLIAK